MCGNGMYGRYRYVHTAGAGGVNYGTKYIVTKCDMDAFIYINGYFYFI